MCGAALGPIGGVVSAIGTLSAGMAQSAMSKYNAKIAKMNAQAAVREGMAQAGATRDQFAQVGGQMRAGLAKAGVDINTGTAAVLQTETYRREEHAAATDIWRGRTEQTKFSNQATLLNAEAKAQKQAAVIGATASLMSALSGPYGKGGSGGTVPSSSSGSGSYAGSSLSLGTSSYKLDASGRILGGI